MATTECNAFLDRLDSWLDGERSPEARAHFAQCNSCRSLVQDLTAITSAARASAETDPEPPAYLWNSIRAQLDAEGLTSHRHPALAACDAFIEQLDSWTEGARSAESRSHLATCPDCRTLAEEFEAITATARSMADDAEPPAYLWNSIRAQLEQEGVIHRPRPSVVPAPAKSWRGWFGLPRPALAGAFGVAVLVVTGLLARGPVMRRINDYRWMQGTQTSTASLTAQLDTVEHGTIASLRSDPLVEAALHRNLAIVDNYIALCEKSVRENPQSEMARDFLYDAYQQKADLLAQMNEQGD